MIDTRNRFRKASQCYNGLFFFFSTIIIRADPRGSIRARISHGRLLRTLSLSRQKQREASRYYNVTWACYGIRNSMPEYPVRISW